MSTCTAGVYSRPLGYSCSYPERFSSMRISCDPSRCGLAARRQPGIERCSPAAVCYPVPRAKKPKTSRKENAVSLTADLGVIDDRRCRIGNELEAVPGAHGCDSRNGNSHVRDLEEVSGEMVYCVMEDRKSTRLK